MYFNFALNNILQLVLKVFIPVIFLGSNVFCQSKSQIDSINHIPFEQKIKFPKKQIPIYQKNSEDAKSLGYLLGEMEAYENLSLLYYYSGKYDLELEYALKSIAGFNKLGDQEKVARFYGELGYRMKRNDMPKAQFYMLKGIKLAEEKKLEKPLMGLYDNYGVLKEMQVQYDSAFYFYQKGLTLKEQFNDSSGLPYSLTNLGGLMVLQKRYDEAKPYFSRALDIRKQLGDTIGICETYLFLSDIYLEQGAVDSALENLNFVIEQASVKGFYEMLSNSYRKRAFIYEKSGDLKSALADERSSRQYKDSLAQQSMRNKMAELQIEFETNEKEKELLAERIKAERFQNLLWILGLLLIIVLLTALSIQIKRTSEKRKLALKNSKDLEFERMRIARDLHDNLGAELTIVTSKLDTKIFKTDKELEKEELEQIAKQTRNAAIVLRETVWSIKTEKLTVNSLKNKIEEFYRRFETDSLFELSFKVSDEESELGPLMALNLYRIAQEALTNILKYAGAKHVKIELSGKLLKIIDDGKGFDIEKVKKGYGLNNMEGRAKEMNAHYEIRSSDRGTEISVLL